jgi:hypothetical protein
MTDHHHEELIGLTDRIKEFLRQQVYPLAELVFALLVAVV